MINTINKNFFFKWYKNGYLFLFNSINLIWQIPMQWGIQQ